MPTCITCGPLGRTSFSDNQLRKPGSERRCKACCLPFLHKVPASSSSSTQQPAPSTTSQQQQQQQPKAARAAPAAPAAATACPPRGCLLLCMEGNFQTASDPSVAAVLSRLQGVGHRASAMPWAQLCAPGAAPALLRSADLVVVFCGGVTWALDRKQEASRALREWVGAGGTLVALACEERSASLFGLLDKPWAYGAYERASHCFNAAAQHASAFPGCRGNFCKGVLLRGVPEGEAVCWDDDSELTSVACGSFGMGRIAALGDVNFEVASMDAIEDLAFSSGSSSAEKRKEEKRGEEEEREGASGAPAPSPPPSSSSSSSAAVLSRAEKERQQRLASEVRLQVQVAEASKHYVFYPNLGSCMPICVEGALAYASHGFMAGSAGRVAPRNFIDKSFLEKLLIGPAALAGLRTEGFPQPLQGKGMGVAGAGGGGGAAGAAGAAGGCPAVLGMLPAPLRVYLRGEGEGYPVAQVLLKEVHVVQMLPVPMHIGGGAGVADTLGATISGFGGLARILEGSTPLRKLQAASFPEAYQGHAYWQGSP